MSAVCSPAADSPVPSVKHPLCARGWGPSPVSKALRGPAAPARYLARFLSEPQRQAVFLWGDGGAQETDEKAGRAKHHPQGIADRWWWELQGGSCHSNGIGAGSGGCGLRWMEG